MQAMINQGFVESDMPVAETKTIKEFLMLHHTKFSRKNGAPHP